MAKSKKVKENGVDALGRGIVGLDEFDLVPGHLIRCCRQIAVAIFLEEMAPFKCTSVQYAALARAQVSPGLDQRTLGDLIAVDRSTIGTLLGRLEEMDLIYREAPPQNQRIKQVFVTPKGAALLDDSKDAIARVQERIMAPLAADERSLFIELIAKMVASNNELSRAPLKWR